MEASMELERVCRLEAELAELPLRTRPFGLLVVQAERERRLLVGERSQLDLPLPLLAWRDSPLARVFMTHRAGEDYELELDDRVLEGRVLRRWLLGYEGGRLVRVDTGLRCWRRDADGTWHGEPLPTIAPWAGPSGRATPRGLVIPDGLLDPQQRAVLAAPAETTLLVEGAAGSGKTTACLRRMVRLCDDLETPVDGEDVSVLVPSAGLARLCRRALAEQGRDAIAVHAYRGWAVAQGRACFPRLPARLCDDTPARVRRLFRHPALLASLPALVEERAEQLVAQVDHDLFARGALLRVWHSEEAGVPVVRLRRTQRTWRRLRPEGHPRRTDAAFGRARRALADPRPTWEALWQDKRLLQRAAELSEGDLGSDDVQAVLDHAWLQFSETTEQAFAHVDPERLATVDGRSLDEGTPDEVAGTIDLVSYTVLLALRTLMLGPPAEGRGPLRTHAHLLVDEIQERAPVELRVLADTLRPGAGLTMSGDRAQRMDGTGAAMSPADGAALAGIAAPTRLQLHHAHRATGPIVRFCHSLLGPMARGPCPPAEREGPAVVVNRHASHGEVLAVLADALRPGAEIAVIAHDAKRAREIHDVLAELAPCELVLDGLFGLRHRGLTVTTVDQVGGMEFDTVWIPDADATSYPQRDGARRKLYVACSRARRQLWVLCPGQGSGLVPDGGESGTRGHNATTTRPG
jgi:DNA helicase II / ATP-dependent DNA helicase PcrA